MIQAKKINIIDTIKFKSVTILLFFNLTITPPPLSFFICQPDEKK